MRRDDRTYTALLFRRWFPISIKLFIHS